MNLNCCTQIGIVLASILSFQLTSAKPILAQTESSASVIRQTYEEQLKAASQGTAMNLDEIEDELTTTIEQQIELFVESASKGDEASKAAAANVRASAMLADSIMTLLSYELRCEQIPEMEAQSIRELMNELGVHVNWDYSIAGGAIPEDQYYVRVRLPKLHACGGCKKALETALNHQEGFDEAMVDLKTLSVQFLAPAECELTTILDDLHSNGTRQLDGWILVRK